MNETIVTDCDYCGDISLCVIEENGKICRKCINARVARIERIERLMNNLKHEDEIINEQ